MSEKIRVAIIDDHQGIIDGYMYRLEKYPEIEVVATMLFGEQLEPTIAEFLPDVLLLDVSIPISPENPNPFPILSIIPRLLEKHKNLSILVISCNTQRILVERMIKYGASGYILKDDQEAIRELPSIIRTIAHGGIMLSKKISSALINNSRSEFQQPLSSRQIEALSLCAAYPNATTAELADKMGVAPSSIRNLLYSAYVKLDVNNRTGAVAQARNLGIITPVDIYPDLKTLEGEINLSTRTSLE
jgi:two-component system, NarL family, nitrate/nitrite response regulator NarL